MNTRTLGTVALNLTLLVGCTRQVPTATAVTARREAPAAPIAPSVAHADAPVASPEEVALAAGVERCLRGQGDACAFAGAPFAAIPEGVDRARALYRRGCADGSAMSCEFAALSIEDGRGLAEDVEAMEFFERACAEGAGSATSCARIGMFEMAAHPGRAARPDRGAHFVRLACDLGDDGSCALVPGFHASTPRHAVATLARVGPAEISRAAVDHAADLTRCGAAVAGDDATAVFAISTESTGRVIGATVAGPLGALTESAERCLALAAHDWRFPYAQHASVALLTLRATTAP